MNRHKWTVRQMVMTLCVALILLTATTGIVGLRGELSLAHSLTHIAVDTLPGVEKLTSIQSLGLEYRGTSLLMGTPGLDEGYRSKQIAHLKELRVQIVGLLTEYGKSVQPIEKETYQNTRLATQSFLQTVDHFLDLALQGHSQEAGDFWSKKGGAQSKLFRKALEDEVKLSTQLINEAAAKGNREAASNKGLSGVFFGAAIILGIGLGTGFSKRIAAVLTTANNDLGQMSEQVMEAANQLASASNHLAEIASVQAGHLEETSSCGTQVAEASVRNAQTCRTAKDLMVENGQHIGEASRRLDAALESMKQIKDASMMIAGITKLVDDIAFQTNILALNAAIEAARAGEAGAGFAVVADEVRGLAARSAEAAKKIAQSVEGSVEIARSGKDRLDEVAAAVQQSASSTHAIVNLIEDVDAQAATQKTSVDRIAKALLEIRRTTQQNAAMSEENAAAGTQLQSQAEMMRQVVVSLEALV